jgi:hypothetical protein
MPVPLTSQQQSDILNSAKVFQDGVNAMNQIYNEVFAAGDQLKGTAMVSTAGTMFGAAIVRWTDDFNNIKALLQSMHDQLIATTQSTANTNAANEAIAQALGYNPPGN